MRHKVRRENAMFACEKFAKVDIRTDIHAIDNEDRRVLPLLIRAAACLNPIYLRQVSSLNPQFKQEIEDTHSQRLIDSFNIMAGPWDRFEGDKPFYGTIEKPLGAGFYPSDMTRDQFEAWCASHPDDEAKLRSFTTVIRRQANGDLVAVPYSEAYALELKKAADLLHEAARETRNPSLSNYLMLRAKALLSNDYAASEAAWIGLDSNIEFVFGPYETYEDQLFGYKATYESFVAYKIAEESARLRHIADLAEAMQLALPMSDEMRKTRTPQVPSPFVVADLLSTAGEARFGIQTLAFVLPNDPEVIGQYGTKKVMLRNIQHAKFDAILRPIAARFLSHKAMSKIGFDAFFRHTILHETGHSLGVKAVAHTGDSIIQALADVYAPIEECKADTISTFLSFWFAERGELTREALDETCATLLAGFFRSLRFGLTQAHARANAIQLNYYMAHGAVTIDGAVLFDYDIDAIGSTAKKLIAEVLDIQYEGSRQRANDFLAQYAILSPDISSRLEALNDIPIDIACQYEAERDGFFDAS